MLADRAERTIDTQYYLIRTDTTSFAFIDALLKAADCGVRVGLLLDDVFTTGYDAGMAALDSHPNFEIRIFNLFDRAAAGRAWSGMTNLSRINRRMHANSLAANNHATVHGGYSPSRKPLLRNGIRIYEVRPDADVPGSEISTARGAKTTTHTKAFLVDRKEVFIGSFNFDPRTANLNTESGVLVRSEQMGKLFGDFVDAGLSTQTYEVFLNEDGKLRWRAFQDGQEIIYKKEPQAAWGQRFAAGFMRMMPVGGQL